MEVRSASRLLRSDRELDTAPASDPVIARSPLMLIWSHASSEEALVLLSSPARVRSVDLPALKASVDMSDDGFGRIIEDEEERRVGYRTW